MSYDLMVFDVRCAPNNSKKFMLWYNEQTEWNEGHDYDDPAVTESKLKSWFLEVIITFPALNGPFSNTNIVENDHLTDYSIGKHIIYACVGYNIAEEAYIKMSSLAEKHGLGFFDPSGESNIFVPNKTGKLVGIDTISNWWKF